MILRADARHIPLRDGCVQCVVTSPPYWGLRDYGTARWDGGDDDCPHQVPATGSTQNKGNNGKIGTPFRDECALCGATRIDQQIGLEPTPEAYVATMVGVFREVRRVLKDDGTVWLNLGSSYAGSGRGPTGWNGIGNQTERQGFVDAESLCARPCDISDTGRSDSRLSDSPSFRLCDGCRAVLPSDRIFRNGYSPALEPAPLFFESTRERMESAPDHLPTSDFENQEGRTTDANLDPMLSQDLSGGPLPAFQMSTLLQSFSPLQGDCRHCANCDACLSVLGSSSRDARLCARRSDGISYTDSRDETWRHHMTDRTLASEAWRYLTTLCLKAKDDCAIPWLVALALRMDGWYLRSDIIWAKPNPMPESVTDRPTRSHEYIFLLSKNERYFYDADAIREESSGVDGGGWSQAYAEAQPNHGAMKLERPEVNGRNKRSVWTINSEPTPEAHFATFPQKLVEPCILAGSSEWGECSQCGKNWVRETESSYEIAGRGNNNGARKGHDGKGTGAARMYETRMLKRTLTTGWHPTCACNAPRRPNLIFDPFIGSGTVGRVAERLGRRWVGLELSEDYIEIAKNRTAQMGLGL